MEFQGYRRANGAIGIRNHILIIAIDECMEGIAKMIAAEAADIIVASNYYTCMMAGNEETLNNLIGIAKHPNIAAVLLLSMGCGSIDPELIAEPTRAAGKPVEILVSLNEKGARNTIARGKTIMRELRKERNSIKREPCPLASLVIGVKCGGSDTISGLAPNPSVGKACDLLVEHGGTAIAGELIELIGCEDILAERVNNPETEAKMRRLIQEEADRWGLPGVEVETMSIGNSVGGLTTIEEKSLGALHKTGTKEILDVLEINQHRITRPQKPGFYLSEVSHLCGASATQFASLGAHMILWTSGGSGFNQTIIPVIRVSGNHNLINEDTDVDVTGIVAGAASVQQMGEKIWQKIIAVANGGPTAIEGIGHASITFYQKDVRLEHVLRERCCQ